MYVCNVSIQYVCKCVPDKSAEAGSSLDIVSGNKMYDLICGI